MIASKRSIQKAWQNKLQKMRANMHVKEIVRAEYCEVCGKYKATHCGRCRKCQKAFMRQYKVKP